MNRSKAGAFRRWLADTFGRDVLGSGTGLLDIAGGKGELSFELANLTGVPTTVVDPRPLQLDRFIKRLLVGIYHRTGPWQAYNHLPVPADASHVRTPGHLRTFFDDHLLRLLDLHQQGRVDEAAVGFQAMLSTARAVAWTEKGLVADGDDEQQPEAETEINEDGHSMPQEDDGSGSNTVGTSNGHEGLVHWPAVQKLVTECSLIVGLHPDQATEAIVDFALRWNKGFAIVPCCVYHKQFPRRRLDGAPVTTYQQFVAYLTAKAPDRIKTATLDFEGKNLVLYALPPAHLDASPK